MKTLKELKTSILEDGIIDDAEVKELTEFLYDDGKIDKEEADFLFELNDATTDKKGHSPEWKNLFVNAITSFLLEDEDSPNEVDSQEAAWLLTKVDSDGVLDENEKALLLNIKSKAKKYPENLALKLQAL